MSYHARLKNRQALKQKLRNRERVFGGWQSDPDVGITETFAKAGFDFVAIDMEHTTISTEEARRIIASCHAEGITCLPRPVSHNNDIVKPLLEAGADGMLIQMVDTPAEVEALIANQKFPPIGRRSYGVNRAHGYGFDFDAYIDDWNDSGILMLQIESIQAVENIDALLQYDEVDGVMIGPYDISGSLGVPGQVDHQKVRDAAKKVVEATARHGKSCCTQVADVTPEAVADVFEQGYTSLVLGSDLFILWKWAEKMSGIMTDFRK